MDYDLYIAIGIKIIFFFFFLFCSHLVFFVCFFFVLLFVFLTKLEESFYKFFQMKMKKVEILIK